MNRRRFLELLGMATAGSTVVYSFPKIIVPKNIAPVTLPVEASILRKQAYTLNPLTPMNVSPQYLEYSRLFLEHLRTEFEL